MSTMTSPILWQNADQSITSIDVPDSIAAAQSSDSTISSHLLSSTPIQSPFPTNEPKSESAKAKIAENTVDARLDAEYQHLLKRAIDLVQAVYDGEWCLPRPFIELRSQQSKRRRLNDSSIDSSNLSEPAGPTKSFLPSLAAADYSYSNDTSSTKKLELILPDSTEAYTFNIPPNSSFYLSDCKDASSFRSTVRNQAQDSGTRSKFDFVLLDPPWPNRSVRRTHKTAGSTYSTTSSLEGMRDLILDLDLDMLMETNCLVGIWITNKASVRDLILGNDGIFDVWGLELVEEWIWLKTTVEGEPVTPLDGVWRKPYEVLLLGRRANSFAPRTEGLATTEVEKRVIIGVPDLHSRKPCLKSLIEPLMEDPDDYRALEVFARHLVAGWWSWGDECVKFNWEGYWKSDDSTP